MNMRAGSVAVVGSAVVDLITRVHTRPRPGETVIAHDFTMAVGGKGCNQAIAAARMGAAASFVGIVGDDPFGAMIRQALHRDGVDARHLQTAASEGTALGMPVVDDRGENAIVIAPRANARLTTHHVREAASLLQAADILLLQGEVPMEASTEAAEVAHAAAGRVVLNAAPAGDFPPRLLALTDILPRGQRARGRRPGRRSPGRRRLARRGRQTLAPRPASRHHHPGRAGLIPT